MSKLKFEKLEVEGQSVRVNRAKIPGGWLLVVMSNSGGGVTFCPDPEHKWDGKSIESSGKPEHAVPKAS
jgi:hypothetical protein